MENDRHYFEVNKDVHLYTYVWVPLTKVKRCVRLEMLQLLTPGCTALGFHAVIAQDTYYLKIHVQIHQINVGIWYKNPIYYQARATKYVLNHDNPGGFLGPIHVYLLRSFFDARRTFMGIKYVLPSLSMLISASATMGKYCCWVLAQHNLLHNHHNQPLATKEARPDKASPTLPHQQQQRVCISLEKKNFKARISLPRRRNGVMVRAVEAERMDWPRR